ncbi:hypothetical protein BDZ88DRAFT_434987 [Geranomyces variabilis]|nr:hypothetical protein BDZ88DRAFT_434987 [Geranomyces variabilis]KAJ3135002.1 hypothetical protein HDU90_004327 [Geranomyces variabilis]
MPKRPHPPPPPPPRRRPSYASSSDNSEAIHAALDCIDDDPLLVEGVRQAITSSRAKQPIVKKGGRQRIPAPEQWAGQEVAANAEREKRWNAGGNERAKLKKELEKLEAVEAARETQLQTPRKRRRTKDVSDSSDTELELGRASGTVTEIATNAILPSIPAPVMAMTVAPVGQLGPVASATLDAGTVAIIAALNNGLTTLGMTLNGFGTTLDSFGTKLETGLERVGTQVVALQEALTAPPRFDIRGFTSEMLMQFLEAATSRQPDVFVTSTTLARPFMDWVANCRDETVRRWRRQNDDLRGVRTVGVLLREMMEQMADVEGDRRIKYRARYNGKQHVLRDRLLRE